MTDGSFYGMLTSEERGRLLRESALIRAYQPGYMLMMENGPAPRAMVLLAGWAKATFVTDAGEEIVLRIYGPGDLFSSEAALGNQPGLETVTALTRCSAFLLPARRFADLITASPGITRAFNLAVLKRAQGADEQIRLRYAPAGARLAHVLLELADRVGTETPDGITIPIELSQEELASMIGASRSTAARELGRLRGLGLIRTGYRTITITSPEQLRTTGRHEQTRNDATQPTEPPSQEPPVRGLQILDIAEERIPGKTAGAHGEGLTPDAVARARAYFDKHGPAQMAMAYHYQEFMLGHAAPQQVPMFEVAVALNLTSPAAIADCKKELQRLVWNQPSGHQRELAEFLINSELLDHLVLSRALQLALENERTGTSREARRRFEYRAVALSSAAPRSDEQSPWRSTPRRP
jgi:CRP/FNR family transcriptional regulator, cyclic AMP receptor protein